MIARALSRPCGFWLTNLLNQYTQREYPGALDARGVANAGFTVEVNGVAATRTGADYYGVGTFNNSSGAVLGELEIEITDPGPPPVPEPTEIFSLATTGRTDPYVIPETPEEFAYDLDGNLITDGRWDYVWDGENRLVSMTIRAQVVTDTAMTRQRMLFDYDSAGRRIRTRTEEYVSSAWVPVSEVRYLYDGWNVIAELDDTSVTRSMTWGPDLSGTEQGAGGVGGLLWTFDANDDGMIPGYDGNGNIIAWLDISDGSLAGTREYGAFGEDVTFSGVSLEIPFGFSTKYQDSLSGLYYYGYRYYNAFTGRWLNRDPIDEQGGVNLYGFVGNNGVNEYDVLGLACGANLTKEEAKALSCAINYWLKDASVFNALFRWGDDDRSITLKMLKHYMSKSGTELVVPTSVLAKNFGIRVANDDARKYFAENGTSPFIRTKIKTVGDLATAVGETSAKYTLGVKDIPNMPGSSVPVILGELYGESFSFLDVKPHERLNVPFFYLNIEGILCCWKCGEYVSDLWMGDLERFGYAKSYPVKGYWSFNR